LPGEDGYRLMPSDTPIESPYHPDWDSSVQEAMAHRPELQQIRHEVQASYLAVLREKDTLLPDLRFAGDYNINAIGRRLTGPDGTSALRNLGRDQFNDANLQLRLDMPLGYRAEHANVRRAQLQLAQRIVFLQESERNLLYALERAYRDLSSNFEQIRIQRSRREANAEQLRARYQEFRAGRTDITALLENMRNLADSIRAEQDAIADYNISLAEFERQKGTIMRHDNVAIIDGPLPAVAQARASAHIRERAQAISLQDLKKLTVGHEHLTPEPNQPPIPAAGAVPVPAILEWQRGLPELPETLPPPRTEMPKN
jgi:outer membrane protein TolC